LEDRTLPSGSGLHLTAGEQVYATGADAGGTPLVNVYDGHSNALVGSFYAYDPRFAGGVTVAVGDVNGDQVPDIITGPGPGGGPDVRVFDGATGALIKEFYAYDPAFSGGVNVAYGHTETVPPPGSLMASILSATIITGAGPGGGPHVKVVDANSLAVLRSFYAYDPHFRGGVRVAAGDLSLIGATPPFVTSEVVTAPGPGGTPDVRIFSSKDSSLVGEFLAYDAHFAGGVYVATDQFGGAEPSDIITGAGAGGGPEVRIFGLTTGTLVQGFYAYDSRFTGGVRVAVVADFGGVSNFPPGTIVDPIITNRIIIGPGPGGGPHVRVLEFFTPTDSTPLTELDSFYAYNRAFTGGVFVG
jgi:hypothetical protein